MSDWSEAMEMLLLTLARDKKSGSEIARSLNRCFHADLTRNAVIGKCHRIGITLISKPGTKRKETTTMVMQRKRSIPPPPLPPMVIKPPPKPKPKPVAPPPAITDGYAFLDIPVLGCKFELGDDYVRRAKDFRFCGQPRQIDSSYCPAHTARVVGASVKARLTGT